MSATPRPDEFVESTTELAVQEKKTLVKSLRRLDMIGLDTLGTVAVGRCPEVHLARGASRWWATR